MLLLETICNMTESLR